MRQPRSRRARRLLRASVGVVILVGIGATITLRVSPWPAALFIRHRFDKKGMKVSRALEKHVPAGVAARLMEHYDSADADAYLDVYYPSALENTEQVLPTIVWIHGGGWVAGSKDQIAHYARILAGRGTTAVAVDYSLAPGKVYPTPLQQANAALAYLVHHAPRLHIDPSRFFLAGDSGGAQIAAQMANIVTVPSYATAVGIAPSITRSQLAGVLLYCGVYDLGRIDRQGTLGIGSKTVLWAYSGKRDFMNDPAVARMSVIDYVTADFPPLFISCGSADPLEPQSRAFAHAVAALGVPVDSLFFPPDHTPRLRHEYQFDLDSEAGRLALARCAQFLSLTSAASSVVPARRRVDE